MRWHWPRITRDTALFLVGIIGVGYETLYEHVDRPSLLAIFGLMLGLPIYLQKDKK